MKRRVYIWQKEGWPHFTWDEEVAKSLVNRIYRLHGELTGRMVGLGFEKQTDSYLSSLTEEIVGSSEIEGVSINPKSVRSSIARKIGIEEDGLLVTDHYVEGLVDVMADAIFNCGAPLSQDRLFDWHAALFPTGRSGMYTIKVAGWREGDEPMQVVSGAYGHEKVHYEAPPSREVEKEMNHFIQWANSSTLPPVIKAAIAHLWVVTIHPFDDGNGRISRTLADMYLSRFDDGTKRYYSMSAEINRNKKSYYEILEKTQKGELDISDWIIWFCECLEKALKRSIDMVDISLQKGYFWECHAGIEINERQRKVINMLWDGFEGKLTTSKWAKICRCSQDTALRDINDLISKNILQKGPQGGRSANYLLAPSGSSC